MKKHKAKKIANQILFAAVLLPIAFLEKARCLPNAGVLADHSRSSVEKKELSKKEDLLNKFLFYQIYHLGQTGSARSEEKNPVRFGLAGGSGENIQADFVVEPDGRVTDVYVQSLNDSFQTGEITLAFRSANDCSSPGLGDLTTVNLTLADSIATDEDPGVSVYGAKCVGVAVFNAQFDPEAGVNQTPDAVANSRIFTLPDFENEPSEDDSAVLVCDSFLFWRICWTPSSHYTRNSLNRTISVRKLNLFGQVIGEYTVPPFSSHESPEYGCFFIRHSLAAANGQEIWKLHIGCSFAYVNNFSQELRVTDGLYFSDWPGLEPLKEVIDTIVKLNLI